MTSEAKGRKAARKFKRARQQAEPIAKRVLEHFLKLFTNLATRHQPGAVEADERKFERWAKLAVDASKVLVAYETPRLSTLQVPPLREELTTFRLRIFDGGREVKRVENGVVTLDAEPRTKPCEPPVVIEGEATEVVEEAPPAPPPNVTPLRRLPSHAGALARMPPPPRRGCGN